jgi:hypothetical protein
MTSNSIGPSIFVLTGFPSSLTEIVHNSNRSSIVNNNSPISCLPRWASKRIEAIGPGVDDISSGGQNQSPKKHANVALVTRVLETFDHVTYSDAQGQPEWE